MPAETINEYLVKLRRKRRWLQRDVVSATGWSQSMVSRIESGVRAPTFEDLGELAELYDVPLMRLVKLRARAS